jgi:hypothetical protein
LLPGLHAHGRCLRWRDAAARTVFPADRGRRSRGARRC